MSAKPASHTLAVGVERGAKKTFVWAIDWPGLCRSGKDEALAIEALLAASRATRR